MNPLIHSNGESRAKLKFLFLIIIFWIAPCSEAQFDQVDNNRATARIAVDLLFLKDLAVAPTDTACIAVRVDFYNSLLNFIGTEKALHDVLYTEKIIPYIRDVQDDRGGYHYKVVLGQEDKLLGYSKCLDATKFRDVFYNDRRKNDAIGEGVDSGNEGYIWVRLNSTNDFSHHGERPVRGYHYDQYIDSAGGWYHFYTTQCHSNSCAFDNYFGQELWVGIRDDSRSTYDWSVTENHRDGLTTYRDGASTTKLQGHSEVNSETASTDNSSPSWREWWSGLTTFAKLWFYIVLVGLAFLALGEIISYIIRTLLI